MNLAHLRLRRRVALLAAGVLDGRERDETRAHVDSCARCDREYSELRALVGEMSADPIRSAEPEMPVSVLIDRVERQLDRAVEARPARAPVVGWRLALPAAAAAVLALVLLVPELATRHPEPATSPSTEAPEMPDALPEEFLDRLERTMAREHAARYLSEAQDVLLAVSATDDDCDRKDDRVDVGDFPDRSRDLLARRALVVEDRPEAVASARAVLDEVELTLREVADLPSCVRRRDVQRLREDIERRQLHMRISLMTRGARGMKRLISALTVALLLTPAAARPQGGETLRNAKTLFFDRQYEDARDAWRDVRAGGGSGAEAALYWIARCSDKLGQNARALEEYGAYLDSGPADRTLREEAKTSRVALAAKLYKSGKTRHLDVLQQALDDSSRTVRYFAALQLASLGPEVGRPAVVVLQEILKDETDPDLVERAKLALLRLDRAALAESTPSSRGKKDGGWIRVRIWEKGASKPQLALNVPVFLADMVFKNLPQEARDELREEGFDASNFWERLKDSGPADILTVDSDDGTRIQVWIE